MSESYSTNSDGFEDCPDCRGQGFFDCHNCDGDPTSLGGCPVCQNEAHFECEQCESTGLVPIGDGLSRDGGQDQPQTIGPDTSA